MTLNGIARLTAEMEVSELMSKHARLSLSTSTIGMDMAFQPGGELTSEKLGTMNILTQQVRAHDLANLSDEMLLHYKECIELHRLMKTLHPKTH